MNKKRTLFVCMLILFIGMISILSGCVEETSQTKAQADQTQGQQNEKKSVTLLFSFTTSNLDPHNSGGWTNLRAGITETLVKLDEDLRLTPWLASSWEQQGEKTWVFTIRDGISFHDGTPLNANGVRESLERAITVNKGVAASLKIDSIEADGQKLTIHTTEPHAILPSELVESRTAIINVEAEKRMGTDAFAMSPIGTGPFKLHKFVPDVELHVVRYEEYWDGVAKLDEAFFKMNTDPNVRALAFQSKEADIVYHLSPENIETIQNITGLAVESVPSLRANFLYFNLQKSPLSDRKVRQAINLLIDRDSIVEHVMLGHAQPANGPFNPQLPFGKKEGVILGAQVEEAKRLLAEAGWSPDSDGIIMKEGQPLTLDLITYKNRPELPMTAQVLQGELAKVGIKVNIKSVENISDFLQTDKDWDMSLYSNMTAPRGDGQFFFNVAHRSDGTLNFNQFHHDEFNQLLTQLNQTREKEQRNELTQEMVDILDQELPQAFLFYPQVIVGVSDRVIGFTPGSEESYMLTNTLDVK
jgi:peptide/nickel transport system substrate-binding protein